MEVNLKKIFVLFCLLISSVCAQNYFEVEWSEFCPQKYANIDSSKWHYTQSGRYWANRKKIFERRLERCNNLAEENRAACYQSLRELETNATQLHNDNQREKNFRRLLIHSMF